MSDQDVFDEKSTNSENTNTNNSETPSTSTDDVFADKLNSIVNDDGQPKYKDVNTALDALNESQQFIKKLQQEKREVEENLKQREEELNKMGGIEDFVNRIAPDTQQPTKQETPSDDGKLSEERVVELLNQTISKRDQQVQASENLKQVVSKLSEKYGDKDKVSAYIKQRANELNTTPQELKELSMKNPSIALQLLNSNVQNNAPASSLNTRNSSVNNEQQLERPTVEKGVARGGMTNKELVDLWKKSSEFTNKRLGVEG